MTELSKDILQNYQVRKTKSQKLRFIELIRQHFPSTVVEESGVIRSRNIIVGDLENAKVIFTAHYDTCAGMPVPNFIAPKNILLTVAYSLLICLPMFAAAVLASFAVGMLGGGYWASYAAFLVVLLGLMSLLFLGKPNKHTANDNTSGVITLCELIDKCIPHAAFVFFDNEENGLLGSMQFRNRHKKLTDSRLLVNFDCVSDGENIMLVQSKKAKKLYGERLAAAFEEQEKFRVFLESSSSAMYPSDQAQFPLGVGVAALKKRRFIGLYMDRIHTDADTVFDEENIDFLVSCCLKLLPLL